MRHFGIFSFVIALGIVLPAAAGDEGAKARDLLSVWEATRSTDQETRHAAISKLQEFGGMAVPLLMEIWHRGEVADATKAVYALASLKPNSKVIAETFQKALLSHPDADVREAVASALGSIQGGDEATVDAVVQGFRDKEIWVVSRCVISLQTIPGATKACPHLVNLIKQRQELAKTDPKSRHAEVAIQAARALSIIDPEGYKNVILQACTDLIRNHRKSYEVMVVGVHVLGKMEGRAKDAIPLLVEVVDDPAGYENVRSKALESINMILTACLQRKQ